jgi:hypothetical protein
VKFIGRAFTVSCIASIEDNYYNYRTLVEIVRCKMKIAHKQGESCDDVEILFSG